MSIRPLFLVLVILGVAALLALPSGAQPTDLTPAASFASASADAFSDTPAELSEERLLHAILVAIENGHWWVALAAGAGFVIAVLRRRGLIHARWLATLASIVLAALGGALHHWMAGKPWHWDALVYASGIAVPMVVALFLPVAKSGASAAGGTGHSEPS